MKALQEMYTLDDLDMTGASAGALCAVLAGCNVDMDRAFELASRSSLPPPPRPPPPAVRAEGPTRSRAPAGWRTRTACGSGRKG